MIEIARVTVPRTDEWTPGPLDEPSLVMLAELVNLVVRRGDTIELEGDLGAGKSTFARALIRACLGDDRADVPSPTFSLVQTYDAARFAITHADLYRLRSSAEAAELGLDETTAAGVTLIEWPERAAADRLGTANGSRVSGLCVRLGDAEESVRRTVTLTAFGSFRPRLVRLVEIWDFLAREWSEALPVRVRFLQGDASARGYARLVSASGTRVLMDQPRQPDGPPVRDGLPYSRIAHLAEDVRAFVAVVGHLDRAGVRVPVVRGHDLERGLLLLDDLGDDVLATLVRGGSAQSPLWAAAVDQLIALRRVKVGLTLPLPDGSDHVLPRYDASALGIEVDLLLDWLWPAEHGAAASPAVASAFRLAWTPILRRLATMADGLVLRDYHSPNLLRMTGGDGTLQIGVIDVQDAVLGPVAYDLASLLFDARVDVSPDLERLMFQRYVTAARIGDPQFDQGAFEFAYAALAVQRNTKILGIFARLSRRDEKHGYLIHLPRIWGYLERGLMHPDLGALKGWYDEHWPAHARRELPEP